MYIYTRMYLLWIHVVTYNTVLSPHTVNIVHVAQSYLTVHNIILTSHVGIGFQSHVGIGFQSHVGIGVQSHVGI